MGNSLVPEGWHTVTPRLFADDPQRLIAFLRDTFGATGELQGGRPAELCIGDSVVMVSGSDARGALTSFLYVYVQDADSTYARAVANDAESIEEPGDTPYGDRRAMVRDPAGNTWQIATRRAID